MSGQGRGEVACALGNHVRRFGSRADPPRLFVAVPLASRVPIKPARQRRVTSAQPPLPHARPRPLALLPSLPRRRSHLERVCDDAVVESHSELRQRVFDTHAGYRSFDASGPAAPVTMYRVVLIRQS